MSQVGSVKRTVKYICHSMTDAKQGSMLCTFLYHFNYYTIHHADGEWLSRPAPTHCSCTHTICSNVVFPPIFIHSFKLCGKLPVNHVMATLTLQQLQHWLSAFNMCGSWQCGILRIRGCMLGTGSSFLLMWWCYRNNTDWRDLKLVLMYKMYKGKWDCGSVCLSV